MFDEKKAKNEIAFATQFITKNYLNYLSEYEVIPLDERQKRFLTIRLYRLEKIVYDKKENINDKLVSVYNAIQSLRSTVVLVIRGMVDSTEIYMGIQSNMEVGIAEKVFSQGFLGNFPGSVICKVSEEETEELMSSVSRMGNPYSCLSCLDLVPTLRTGREEQYIQGLEKFIDTMKGEDYACIVIASSVPNEECETRIKGFEEIYSSLYPYVNMTLSHGTSEGTTITEGFSTTVSESVANGISMTTGQTVSDGTSIGFNVGLLGLAGFSNGKNHTETQSISNTKTNTTTLQTGTTQSNSESHSMTANDNYTLSYKDRSLEDALKQVDQRLDRLRECLLFGMWDCAAYFVADNMQTSVVAANTFRSLLLGSEDKCEKSYLNSFGRRDGESTQNALESICYCRHPRFRIKTIHGDQYVTATEYVSGKELPVMVTLPRKSVPGLTVMTMAEFGRNISKTIAREEKSRKTINIGKIFHMDGIEKTPVELDLESFSSHCFVTGSTGSGKSNTTFCLLKEFSKPENGIPFLVVEPAKGEYKYDFCNMPNINIFCTNSSVGRFLRINPFSFDLNIHILEHLDRLIDIFNTCWEMYAAMPAILKDAIEKTYEKKGWDLLNSVYTKEGIPEFPTFKDLLRELPLVINSSGYSSDTKGDYIGALVTRVNSLTNGIVGQIFCNQYDISDEEIFDQNTIVDLSRIGSSETKSLIMGILVLKLTEHRMATTGNMNVPLRHVTILEEAHNLLKNTRNSGSPASSVVSKSVEMICNSIAEVRAYGEGFILVDQSPTSVDIAAIKNTNTKIIMRLPEMTDCETVGRSVSLNEDQIAELSRLKTGVAVVMQNNWNEAVLAKINHYEGDFSGVPVVTSYKMLLEFKSAVIGEILNQYVIQKTKSVKDVLEVIECFDIDIWKKMDAKQMVIRLDQALKTKWDSRLLGVTLKEYSGAEGAFHRAEKKLVVKDKEIDTESVPLWYQAMNSEVDTIVRLDTTQRRRLIQYMTFAKCYESAGINYDLIYRANYNIK